LGWQTAAPDVLDWDDEIRLAIEERTCLSPDALTGMEASLRFGGAETMETRIFRAACRRGRNWIFNRPNAVGEAGGAEDLRGPVTRRVSTGSGFSEGGCMSINYKREDPQITWTSRVIRLCSGRWSIGNRSSSIGGRRWGRTASHVFDVYLRTGDERGQSGMGTVRVCEDARLSLGAFS